jgi:hypothetical protein
VLTRNRGSEGFAQRIRWLHARAEETRALAEDMRHSNTRITMLHIADTYEKVADQLENDGAPDEPRGPDH